MHSKWPVIMFAMVALPGLAFGQFPANVDSVYTFIKYNSVHRLEVDWQPIESEFAANIKSAATLDDTMRCFVDVLRALNDIHSQIFLNGQYYGHYPSFDDSVLARLKPLNDLANSETNHVTDTILKGQFAYVRVPGMQPWSGQAIDALAIELHENLKALAHEHPKGFIVDLRLNGGGNMYPMLTGLRSLLGTGIIGYETTPDDSIARVWEMRDGNFVIQGYRTTSLAEDSTINLDSIPVAVLIGPVTKSSGSATAIAFKGRPRTTFIGEPTADGYSTSNGYFQFAPNLIMNFATTFVADRKMTIYKRTVDPDITVILGDNFDDLVEDAKIKAAFEWLSRQ